MAFRTAVVIASFLIGLGGLVRESFAQYYPPQAYPPPRGYPLAGYEPLPPVDADEDAPQPPRYYDLPATGRSHTGAAGPGQVDPLAPGLMRGDPRTLAALPPEVRPETGPKKELPPQFRRTLVDYYTKEPAGTIVIDTPNTYLYLVLGNGKGLRYGIGVGREGFTLGARALYLGDTLYRIHGTNQPSTIGTFVSSGCIRLTNEDIMDLYKRVKVGTRVVVLPSGPPMTAAAPIGSRRGISEVTPYGLPSASDMPRKRYKPEEITAKLQQVDVLVAQGQSIADAARQVGITESRYYRWREERGALKRDELKKPKELAHEGPKGLAQGEVSAVRDNAQREFKAESAGFEE